MGKKIIPISILIFVCFFITSCNNDNRLTEGKIEYKISYPCLEESNNPMRMFLPKKMVTTFKNHCYKNEFIFSADNFKLELFSECHSKKTKLGFAMGKNRIYTELDSNSITDLLSELPVYSKQGDLIDEGFFLNKPYKKFKVMEKDEEKVFEIKTTDAISIDNVNWCTPFNEFDEVLLDYRIYQYGLDMQFTATDIIDVSVKDDILKMSPDYHYEDFYNYISEIKEIMKTFSCE